MRFSPTYRIEALATNPPINELVASLKVWRDRNKSRAMEERQGLKLLFYGPPGLGKTELANYLAYELDLELTQARVSDVMSPWVGESERNLANLFRKRESSLGILLIDELESLLFSRDMALRSWELRFVNEFLTCLDLYKGLFIGTTNRPDRLDNAGLRRLGRKVEFRALEDSGKIELFEAFLKPLTGRALNKTES
ncbi:MAG: ATP-binding protein [Deltaproteobacteria bacterium]|nr:ATP-binding protein [Deltaproteobacteria bacterium]